MTKSLYDLQDVENKYHCWILIKDDAVGAGLNSGLTTKDNPVPLIAQWTGIRLTRKTLFTFTDSLCFSHASNLGFISHTR